MKPQYEIVSPEHDGAFRCAHFVTRSLTLEHGWHYHKEIELTLILNGSGTRFVGDSVEAYQAGDLVLVGSSLPHCWVDSVARSTGEAPELIVLQFDPLVFGDRFMGLEETADLRALAVAGERGLAFEDPEGRARGLLKTLSQAAGLERIAVLFALLAELQRQGGRALASAPYRAHPAPDQVSRDRIETVHALVRDGFKGPIVQAEIAAEVGLSPQHFSRFFKERTGVTFVEFVNAYRIHHACELLRTTERQITQVALDSGFQNLSNFNRQFRARHGMSPRDYRDAATRIPR